jgi:hypothetical protein
MVVLKKAATGLKAGMKVWHRRSMESSISMGLTQGKECHVPGTVLK